VQWAKYRNLDELKPTLDIGAKDFLACLKYALACNLTLSRKKSRAIYYNEPVSTYTGTSPAAARPTFSNRRMLKLGRSSSKEASPSFWDDDD
jgi:hypothetical protein